MAYANYDWPQIQARFLNGEPMSAISRSMKNRPTVSAIYKCCEKENWKALLPAQLSKSHEVTLKKDRPEIHQKILALLQSGATFTLAARTVGVHPDTLANWRKGSPEFRDQCEQAKAQFAVSQLKRIESAGQTDWRAARFLLQAHPDTKQDFGSQTKGPGGLVINFGIIRDAALLKDVTPHPELINTGSADSG